LKLALFSGLFLFLFVTFGCVSFPCPERGQFPYPPDTPPEEDTILHLPTGQWLDEKTLLDMLADARVIFVSEVHDSPGAHRVQAEIIQGLSRRFPGGVVVGMEMFPHTVQESLDRWNAGTLSGEEFQRLWRRCWGERYELYRPVFNVIRKNRIPVIGLNAPKSVIRKLFLMGFPRLSPEIRRQLPEMDFTDPYERQFLTAIFKGHSMGSGQLNRFILIQIFWEETMAEHAARYLKSHEGRSKKMIILAGEDHIQYGFGIPRRLFRRLPDTYYTVKPQYISLSGIPPGRIMGVKLPSLPLPVADFLWFIRDRHTDASGGQAVP